MTTRSSFAQKNLPMVDSPSGLRTKVISRVAGFRKASARFPFSSESTATYVPFGETFAVFTFADRVNIARPVGSDEVPRADAVSACLHDAPSSRRACSVMRLFIDVRLLEVPKEPDRSGSRTRARIRAGGARRRANVHP